MTVKNIIFDLGGVLLNIDYHRTAKAFIGLGLDNFDEIYSQQKQEHFFDDFEKGLISDADFRNTIRRVLNQSISDKEIDTAWNAMLLDFPVARVNFLKSLKNKYRIFLLSNTNVIHINGFNEILEQAYGPDLFSTLFEKVYYSCSIGMRKPDKVIFEKVLEENQLLLKETLFVDDSIQHIEGARAIGLHALLLEKGKEVESLIRPFI